MVFEACGDEYYNLVSPFKFKVTANNGFTTTASCPFNSVNVGVRGTATFVGFLVNLATIAVLQLGKFEGLTSSALCFLMGGVTICAFSAAVLDANAVRIGNGICEDKEAFYDNEASRECVRFFFERVGEVEEQCRLFYSNSSNHLGTGLFRRNDLCLDVRNPRGLHVDQIADRACLPRFR